MNKPISKSSLSRAQSQLVDLLQKQPFCRIERLQVRDGEPVLSPPPKIIQRLKMGADNGPRAECALPDYWLKKPIIELLTTIAELGDGEIKTIECQHGLPVVIEIERQPVPDDGGL